MTLCGNFSVCMTNVDEKFCVTASASIPVNADALIIDIWRNKVGLGSTVKEE